MKSGREKGKSVQTKIVEGSCERFSGQCHALPIETHSLLLQECFSKVGLMKNSRDGL